MQFLDKIHTVFTAALITASTGGDASDAIQQSEIVSRGSRENVGPEARRVGML